MKGNITHESWNWGDRIVQTMITPGSALFTIISSTMGTSSCSKALTKSEILIVDIKLFAKENHKAVVVLMCALCTERV
jgi:hypothetical protein